MGQNLSSCYEIYANESDRPQFCTLMSKLPTYKHFAYEDPTTRPPNNHYKNFTINNLSTPISPYVHGLSVRPTFNGCPLSWFTSKGEVGVGYSTAEKENIDVMKSVMRRNGQLNPILAARYNITDINYRIDIYMNRQSPANLLYYDSAMSVAKKNLMSGLSGLYFIRDRELEKIFPDQKYEHYILIHPKTAYTRRYARFNSSVSMNPVAISTAEEFVFFRDNVYRIRIANADFTKIYKDIKFVGLDSSNNTIAVDFWIIGADSSLSTRPYGPLHKIDFLAPSERYDLLIKFDKSLQRQIKVVYGDN